jgi:predicted AAA+ superfamily ATPase
VHFVRPHFANFGKRLIKAPKLYMTDAGLAAALLGIQTAQQMAVHPLRGAFFETMVVNEFLKSQANAGLLETLYFWRDNIGTEVDLVLERGTEIAAVEMMSGPSVASDAFCNLKKWHQYASERGQYSAIHLGLVYGGDERYTREGVDLMPWADLA